ncbi:unnamed protein product [Ilex paraguariensis]|uniref:Uncharacterized protein n=1 Tax=Ilex paraguariensis TaxID=185542 RepID=A0ABC8T300_9AQUA
MKEIHHKGGGRTGSNTSTWGGRGDVGNGHGSKTTARLLGKQIYGATPNPSIGTPSNPSLNQETFASALVEKQSGTSWSVVVEVAKDGGNMKSWNKAKDKGKEKINEEKGGQITIELQTSPSAVPDLGIFVELLGFLVLDGAAGLLLREKRVKLRLPPDFLGATFVCPWSRVHFATFVVVEVSYGIGTLS